MTRRRLLPAAALLLAASAAALFLLNRPPGGPDSLQPAYEAYRRAVLAEDWEAVKAAVLKAKAEEMERQGMKKNLTLLKSLLPDGVEVEQPSVKSRKGVLKLKGNIGGSPATGEVRFEAENGRWKLAGESWTIEFRP